MLKWIAIAMLAVVACASSIELHDGLVVDFKLPPTAEARVGRPLTPVSVAGVARRSARRCAAGVYYC
ncbi:MULTISPECIES: hypothetical protein [unclassified Rhizobium]|uniref:hypothetical protein n=1 Tax=unclassified Rhizobium TaxID=2613769 RepID=UPI0016091FAE|nr:MULTISPECIES: hypothetical protein [unclassified Rhizobium]MBB3319554.1 hypothetical protein [Rhizobium sp. BK181]MCS3743504.1 hypothetical protein [Rhizobium sp. BK661]MCS4095195.1 hypothetical protein [Rhizobium sp. BK176]